MSGGGGFSGESVLRALVLAHIQKGLSGSK
jgi:hypothetical protein